MTPAQRAFRRQLRRRQRAIVRAPKGQKNRAWAELRAFTTELLEQHVKAA